MTPREYNNLARGSFCCLLSVARRRTYEDSGSADAETGDKKRSRSGSGFLALLFIMQSEKTLPAPQPEGEIVREGK